MKLLNALLCGALLSLAACQTHPMENATADQVKQVRILEKPDVSTLDIYGHVETCVEIPASESDPEEAAREALVGAALRQFPNTGVMFMVDLHTCQTARTYCLSGIAARRKGT